MFVCEKCCETMIVGLAVGTVECPSCKIPMKPLGQSPSPQSAQVAGELFIGGKVSVGGSLTNFTSGKIKVFPSGNLHVEGDLLNAVNPAIRDPEKTKSILVECIKTAGNLAELGSNVLKKFFPN